MCGISGFYSYSKKVNTKHYYDAHKKLAHRGPDDEGFIYKNENDQIEYLKGDDTIDEYQNREHISSKPSSSLILGHRRLSIIDLTSHGHQPFIFENLYLVYNGEIYNYIELREELKTLGYVFETETDTEVFLKAYHCWGVASFNKFNGMWAAAVYDQKKDQLLLTRDRFGIKPLYYSIVGEQLIFGSEIKFVASFLPKLYANGQAVYDYLRFNYLGHTKQTFFKDIFQIEPNSYMIYSGYGMTVNSYWNLKVKTGVSQREIEQKLTEAIELRMRSDVEVGSLLSGGIDSSTILGIIDNRKLANNFQSFSAVFKEEEYSEKKYIEGFRTKNIKLAKHYIYPDPIKLQENIDTLIYVQEEPFRSLAVYSQYDIYRNIKSDSNAKVLLNGQGADEIFTGYTEYYFIYLLELLRRFRFSRFLTELNALSINRKISRMVLVKQLVLSGLSLKFRKYDKYNIFTQKFDRYKIERRFQNLLNSALWNSLNFSALREYLRYEDKNSMEFSLESRLPFLDYRLVEDAFSLDDEQKINNGVSKVILRKIAKGKISNEILERKDKMGFVSPQEKWQKTILSNEFDGIFEEIRIHGVFDFIDKDRIYGLYQAYKHNTFKDWAFIWRVYCLYKWKKVWGVE